MSRSPNRHSATFKARVALDAAKQTKTLAELAKIYQVHSVQISKWKFSPEGSGNLRRVPGTQRDAIAHHGRRHRCR